MHTYNLPGQKDSHIRGKNQEIKVNAGIRGMNIDVNRESTMDRGKIKREDIIERSVQPRPEDVLKEKSKTGHIESPLERGSITIMGWPSAQLGFPSNSRTSVYQDSAGIYRIDVVVEDPITKKMVNLKGVALNQVSAGGFQKIKPDSKVLLSTDDVAAIRDRRVNNMTAQIVDGPFKSTTTAVPTDVIYQNRRAQAASAIERTCTFGNTLSFDQLTQNIQDLPNLTFLTDPDNPKAPGMVIDSSRQEMTMYHSRGNQLNLTQDGVVINADKFDIQSSKNVKNAITTGGLPSQENPVRDMVPASNIMINAPMVILPFIPAIQGIMLGLSIMYKLIKVGEAAQEMLSEI